MKRNLILTAAALLVATAAVAEEATIPPEAHAAYRHKLMEAIGADMSSIGTILKNGLPHTQNIAVHARSIEAASGLVESAFKAKAMTMDTESLPVIWEKWEDFLAAARATEEAAGNLAVAAESGDMAAIGGAMRGLGRTCGGCHNTFRKDD